MKTAVLVSGGVDSSVALRLLQEADAGDLTAFYLKIWLEDEMAFLGDCPWEEDLRFVREVCAQAGVPLEIISLQSEYRKQIVAAAIHELQAGRTPSPDIQCNVRIKFGAFLDRIDASYAHVASGHYARVQAQGDHWLLLRAPDPVKDQTYFLSRLRQDQLRRVRFPIGHLHKAEVRALARRFALPNRDRPDSQGICFLGKIKFHDFVQCHLGRRPGPIVDVDTGQTLGEHEGYWFFTIGQRQGLKLGGGPWYVVRKAIDTNTVYVAHAGRMTTQSRSTFGITDLHWIHAAPAVAGLQVRVRHGPALLPCSLVQAEPDRWDVALADPDPGIAPGQTAVLYDGEVCLGAGTIL